MKKTKKQQNKKRLSKPKKSKALFSWGNLSPEKGRQLILVVLIIFFSTVLLTQKMISPKIDVGNTQVLPIKKQISPLQRQISDLVKGYPIEKMTPYIFQRDPKVAAFLISIAKKESNWGVRKPVLDGKDCYNYWGFRLKSDKMGSGGHTCFDSPEEAVDAVASRLDQLVNQENIDSPKEMIVWKCGYGCEDKSKTSSEKKWIKDVDYYYGQLIN